MTEDDGLGALANQVVAASSEGKQDSASQSGKAGKSKASRRGRKLSSGTSLPKYEFSPQQLLDLIATIYSKKVLADAIADIKDSEKQNIANFIEEMIVHHYGAGIT